MSTRETHRENTRIKVKFIPDDDVYLSRKRYNNKYYLYIYKYGLGGSKRICTIVIEVPHLA